MLPLTICDIDIICIVRVRKIRKHIHIPSDFEEILKYSKYHENTILHIFLIFNMIFIVLPLLHPYFLKKFQNFQNITQNTHFRIFRIFKVIFCRFTTTISKSV